MAGWLCNDVGFKTVLIVRHPCAVVESQCRAGATWNPQPLLAYYKSNDNLHSLTDGRYRELLDHDLTALEAMALNWIIENQQPIEDAARDGYSVIAAEDLVTTPDESWPALCRALELQEVPKGELLLTPSQQASDKSSSNHDITRWQQAKWRQTLTQEQIDSVQRMLDASGCDIYNVDKDLPNLPNN